MTDEEVPTRDDVLHVVIRHLQANVEHLEGQAIDPARAMSDLGASSLDIVEVVSCSMRELRVKIPRTELVGLANIDAFVDVLYGVAKAART